MDEETVYQGNQKSYCPSCAHNNNTKSSVHDHGVDQRVTDGSIAIISHGRQKAGFCSPRKCEKETLGDTAPHRDGFILREEILKHLGHSN